MLIQKMAESQIALAETVKGNDKFRNSAVALANELLSLKITVKDIEDGYEGINEGAKNGADAMFNAMNPLTAYKNSLVETGKALDNIAVNSMKKFEDSIVEGLKSGKLAFKDFATYVVEQLIRVAIQQLVIAKLVDPFRAALSGGNLGQNLLGDTDSIAQGFAGGGYTGNGARAGGVDGKGGFPAILHPNETVIDHAQGQGMGATVNFNISTVDAAGFDELLASRKGLITSIINNAMNNRGRMGVT
jgi:lambda family phage tail tape measure protein